MPTIDLSTPPPPPENLLDGLPRRVTMTLPELKLVAERAGGAPLPFEEQAPAPASEMESRLGGSRKSATAQAHTEVMGSLNDAETSLTRRGLITDGEVDPGLLGAVGLLATPTLALDLDVAMDGMQARSWHRQSGDAVATLATSDGIVFELAWLPVSQWPGELARVAMISEESTVHTSKVPAYLRLPYELADSVAEAIRSNRVDLVPVLVSDHWGKVLDENGDPIDDAQVASILTALSSEAHGRLRGLAADVSSPEATVVGVVSWTLLADGWRSLTSRSTGDGPLEVELRAVQAEDLATALAPVVAAVTR